MANRLKISTTTINLFFFEIILEFNNPFSREVEEE